MTKTSEYDPAKSLTNAEGIAYFVNDAFETGDPSYIVTSIGIAIRARGIVDVSTQTGLSSDELSQAFGEKGEPSLKTTLAVLKAIGIKIQVKSNTEPSRPGVEGQ